MSTVNSVYSVSANQTATDSSSSATALPGKTLSQQDFLKLLVAQMSAQDPMNPQSSTDFAAQMAQFSALQTSQATQVELTKLRGEQAVQQANELVGRTVTLLNADSTTSSGTVSGVQMNAGSPLLMVNGVAYDLSQLLLIQPTTTPQP
jgi:flagellar basal-body rod modification protein FlgD